MRLTPFSYVVLTLVGEGGATAPELAEMRDRGRIYWQAPRSQWYAEPKRLAEAGLLAPQEEPGRTGPRTRYRLTDAGRAAVTEWVRTPAGLPKLQQEGVVRLLAADLAEPGDVLAGLTAMREELAGAREAVREGERVAPELGARGERLLVNHRLAHRMLDALEQWLDEVEPLLGGR
ncbi:PadR family transcriptional regulator [Conexibacter sp. SYSU D00693]|uniref:PadR family transcriptional regulator n=1 Tax=Conexibacter sp. SYSU D00693 TaxID=2812560 RepID=UPI00196A4966|nr:helix-turn-helix transcriptional regulator [Conexibacter sp. SYSU D00693]